MCRASCRGGDCARWARTCMPTQSLRQTFHLKWEFPGGKVQSGESPEAALIRELREELAIDAKVGAEIHRTKHKYAEMPSAIELIFFAATIESGEDRQSHIRSNCMGRAAEIAGNGFPRRGPRVHFQAGNGRHSTAACNEREAATPLRKSIGEFFCYSLRVRRALITCLVFICCRHLRHACRARSATDAAAKASAAGCPTNNSAPTGRSNTDSLRRRKIKRPQRLRHPPRRRTYCAWSFSIRRTEARTQARAVQAERRKKIWCSNSRKSSATLCASKALKW